MELTKKEKEDLLFLAAMSNALDCIKERENGEFFYQMLENMSDEGLDKLVFMAQTILMDRTVVSIFNDEQK